MQNEAMATAHPSAGAPGVGALVGRSAVSWPAIFAGAAIGAALSIALLVGGSGLGFLAMSPWQGEGAGAITLGVGSVLWLLITQVIAFGIAGYITGRLRTRWTDLREDEITFRDTAHGFLAWAVSALVTVVVLGFSAAQMASGAAQTGAALAASGVIVAPQSTANESGESSLAYFSDVLLRPGVNPASNAVATQEHRGEVHRVLVRSLSQGEMSTEDRTYLARVVAEQSGLTEAEAEQRVEQVTAQARQSVQDAELAAREAADVARQAAAALALWAFIAMLLGAFSASYTAMFGGRTRDRVV